MASDGRGVFRGICHDASDSGGSFRERPWVSLAEFGDRDRSVRDIFRRQHRYSAWPLIVLAACGGCRRPERRRPDAGPAADCRKWNESDHSRRRECRRDDHWLFARLRRSFHGLGTVQRGSATQELEADGLLLRLGRNRFYCDALLLVLVALPVRAVAQFARFVDWFFIDGFVSGAPASAVEAAGLILEPVQGRSVVFLSGVGRRRNGAVGGGRHLVALLGSPVFQFAAIAVALPLLGTAAIVACRLRSHEPFVALHLPTGPRAYRRIALIAAAMTFAMTLCSTIVDLVLGTPRAGAFRRAVRPGGRRSLASRRLRRPWSASRNVRHSCTGCCCSSRAAFLGLFFTDDSLLFCLSLESSTVLLFLLISGWGAEEGESAARKFLAYNLAGDLLVLIAIPGTRHCESQDVDRGDDRSQIRSLVFAQHVDARCARGGRPTKSARRNIGGTPADGC